MLVVLTTSNCVTEEQKQLVGTWEKFEDPQGLFPELVDKKSYASGKVSYYFVAAKEKMVANPTLMFRVMAYFEWLFNELRTDNRITTQNLVSLIEARNKIRDMIAMPHELSSAEATSQFYSLSKFMALSEGAGERTNSQAILQPSDLDQRRRLLASARGVILRAVAESKKIRLAESGDAIKTIRIRLKSSKSIVRSSLTIRPIAVEWEGYGKLIAGKIELDEKKGGGKMSMQLPDNDGSCTGSFKFSADTKGTWAMACTNSTAASGTFKTNGPNKGSSGEGADTKGRKVKYTIGAE